MRADWRTVPPHVLKVIYTSIFVSELVIEAYEVIHALIVANRASCVKYISAIIPSLASCYVRYGSIWYYINSKYKH